MSIDSEQLNKLRAGIKEDFNEALSQHVSPCPALRAILEEQAKRAQFWDGVKSGVLTYGLSAIAIALLGMLVWAATHGAPITFAGP